MCFAWGSNSGNAESAATSAKTRCELGCRNRGTRFCSWRFPFKSMWVWLKIKQEGLRRFRLWSMASLIPWFHVGTAFLSHSPWLEPGPLFFLLFAWIVENKGDPKKAKKKTKRGTNPGEEPFKRVPSPFRFLLLCHPQSCALSSGTRCKGSKCASSDHRSHKYFKVYLTTSAKDRRTETERPGESR